MHDDSRFLYDHNNDVQVNRSEKVRKVAKVVENDDIRIEQMIFSDMKLRKEGFRIEFMMKRFDQKNFNYRLK